MFENLFTPSPLIWGGLIAGLVALPVLIHLINMLRHKRVKWAAMDFLMQSHKRQRNWIWLKQLLLLLSRIAILLLGLFTLANIGCQNQLASGLLGGRTTHHYVLLDDSFSMSDSSSGSSAFDHAMQTVQTIASRASGKRNQRITLLRFSQAAVHSGSAGTQAANSQQVNLPADVQQLSADEVMQLEDEFAMVADLNGVQIDSSFAELFTERRSAIEVSQMAVGPEPALSLVMQLIEQRNTEDAAVHVLSDFREQDWQESNELLRQIESASKAAKIEFVRCVEKENANLAITQLAPVRNIRAAGVPLFCDVRVKNFSANTATNLTVEITSVMFDAPKAAASADANIETETTELPTVFFKEIPPGESATQRFSVFFSKPGSHLIQAQLPDDAVSADNLRQAVIRTADSDRVLLVDDQNVASQNQASAFYLSSVFEPGGNRRTGVSTRIVTTDWFRSVDAGELSEYTAIYLLDVPRLEPDARRLISTYVAAGGGLGVFVGPKTDVTHYNESLYRGGEGFFPLPLERTHTLPERTATGTSDILPTDHSVFAPLVQTGGTLLDLVQIESIMAPPIEWSPKKDPDVHVAAWVRNVGERPLMVDKAFGRGRVVAMLTTAAPQWHNWNKNPTFVVTLLELQDFLSAGRSDSADERVGSPIRVTVDANRFRPDATAIVPIGSAVFSSATANDPTARSVARDLVHLTAAESADDENKQLMFQFGSLQTGNAIAANAGIYDLLLTGSRTGATEVRRSAVNVDTLEGDLTLAGTADLANNFAFAAPKIVNWNEIDPEPFRTTASTLSKWLLIVLVLLLVLEQVLAWALGFHPKRGEKTSVDNSSAGRYGGVRNRSTSSAAQTAQTGSSRRASA